MSVTLVSGNVCFYKCNGLALDQTSPLTVKVVLRFFRLTPSENRGDLGVVKIHPNLYTAQAFGIELLLTFVLVFATYATYDYQRGIPSGVHPIVLGIVVTMLHIVGVCTL